MDTKPGPPPSLSILHLEDSAVDADYFARMLTEGGIRCRIILASSKEEFLRALGEERFDLVLSDNAIPAFSGKEALDRVQAEKPGVPFIFLSGSIGEDAAIEAIRDGATDYILKDRPSRLVSAIQRAMKEKAEAETRRLAEEALRLSEERYALAAMGSNDGLWDWDLKSDTLFYSSRWKAMLGHLQDEIGSSPEEWFGRIHPEDADAVRIQVKSHLKGSIPKLECEYRIRNAQGGYIWALCRGVAIRDAEGRPYRMAGSQGDITERKRAEEQLLYDAFHDALTGLFNRNLFLNRLQRLLWRDRRNAGSPFAVVIFGLDRLGAVNDGLGRRSGDLVLKEAARRLQERVGAGDTLARLGGDEFAVLLEDQPSSGDVIRLARRVQEDFRPAFRIEGREAFLSLSAGIVHGTGQYGSPEEVLRDAGIALGNAKSRGKSGFCVFDQGMHDRAVSLLDLETDLRHAIQKDQFVLHYQPIIDLTGRGVTGFEALVRWQHPVRGLVPPMEFIPIAEESSLINDIGRLVLEKACGRLGRWSAEHRRGDNITMSVNVSGKQFRQPDLIDQIRDAIGRAGIRPGSLKLEITETAIMDDPMAAAGILEELKSAGINLQIDDFGTGYSSLSYLHRFPMQALKIDRSFVQPIGENGRNAQIASTIVSMARNLGMQVIAEGIETETHYRALREMGCQFGQGFYFSRPLDEPAADALVATLE